MREGGTWLAIALIAAIVTLLICALLNVTDPWNERVTVIAFLITLAYGIWRSASKRP